LGFIGSGSYASRVLIPAFKASGAHLRWVASAGGSSAMIAGRKFGFERATTDVEAMLGDPDVGAVVVATRHDTHADFVCRALTAGKHVFVEKPLALTSLQLESIDTARQSALAIGFRPIIAVGFNRRFAPHTAKISSLLRTVPGPKTFIMTVNAGAIGADHWTQSPSGGGRIIGEACHFIDLLRYLAATPIERHSSSFAKSGARDTATITLDFADGSIGTVHYFAIGNRSFPKERLEIFVGGRVLQLDNFRRLRGFGWPGFGSMSLWHQDKGQRACAAAFVAAIENGDDTVFPYDEAIEASFFAIKAAHAC
jgi:predicted dehydrogenase